MTPSMLDTTQPVAKILIYADNEELQIPAVAAAIQTVARTSGYQIQVQNPIFLGEMLDQEARAALSTARYLSRVQQAARKTLYVTGTEIRTGLLLKAEEMNAPAAAEEPLDPDLDLGASSWTLPVVPDLPLSADPLVNAGGLLKMPTTSPADGIVPLAPATGSMIPPVDLSPVTNPEGAVFDVATLDSVSEPVAQAMKQRGWSTVGILRSLSPADLEALPGVGKRIALRIHDELNAALPPAPPAAPEAS